MESNAPEKSINKSIAVRFFARTPKIRRTVKTYDVVDRFLRKSF